MNRTASAPAFRGRPNTGQLSSYGGASGNEEWAAPPVPNGDRSKAYGGGETSVFSSSACAIASAFGFTGAMSKRTPTSGGLKSAFGSLGNLTSAKDAMRNQQEQQTGAANYDHPIELTRPEPNEASVSRLALVKPRDFVGCEISFVAKKSSNDDGSHSDDESDTSEITLVTNRMEEMRAQFIKEMLAIKQAQANNNFGVTSDNGNNFNNVANAKSAGLAFDPTSKSLYQANTNSNSVASASMGTMGATSTATGMGMGMGMGKNRSTSASAMQNINLKANLLDRNRLELVQEEQNAGAITMLSPFGNNAAFNHGLKMQPSYAHDVRNNFNPMKSAGLAHNPSMQNHHPSSNLGRSTSACEFRTSRRLEQVQEESNRNNNEEFDLQSNQKQIGFWKQSLFQKEVKKAQQQDSANSATTASVTADTKRFAWFGSKSSDDVTKNDQEDSNVRNSWFARELEPKKSTSSKQENKGHRNTPQDDYCEENNNHDNGDSNTSQTDQHLLNSIIELKLELAQKQSLIDELSSKVSKHIRLVNEKDESVHRLEQENGLLKLENERLAKAIEEKNESILLQGLEEDNDLLKRENERLKRQMEKLMSGSNISNVVLINDEKVDETDDSSGGEAPNDDDDDDDDACDDVNVPALDVDGVDIAFTMREVGRFLSTEGK